MIPSTYISALKTLFTMKFILVPVMALSSLAVFSQSIEVEGVALPSTKTFEFKLAEEYAYQEDGLQVIIGKYDNGPGTGVIKLTARTGDGLGIKGRVSLQLDDGSTLVLEDKGRTAYENDRASNIFDLSTAQIESLKKRNLRNIRFSIKCINCFLSTKEGNFVANNDSSIPVLEMVDQLFSQH